MVWVSDPAVIRDVFGGDPGALLVELLRLVSSQLLFTIALLVHPARLQRALNRMADRMARVAGRFDLRALVPGGRLAMVMREVDELLFAEFARRRAEDDRQGA